MINTILSIRKRLQETLGEGRYEHTLGVAYTSVCLAMKYGADLHQTEIAGLLHDCAKYVSGKEQIEQCRIYGIDISKAELANPALLHAKLGAVFAAEQYQITDPAILDAIRYHTTGRPDMTLLEKIVFVADYIEPRRDKAPNLVKIRQTAFEDIDRAVWMILDDTLSYLHSRPEHIDSATEMTCRYYRELVKGISE